MLRSVKIKPGQKGAKKLQSVYGNKLLCVRYRYDAVNKRRLKTVELILEESHWQPKRQAISDRQMVRVRVALKETAMQDKIRKAGGKWNREAQLWELSYLQVKKLGLENRMVKPKSLSIGKPKSLR